MCCDLNLDEYERLDRLEERSALVVSGKDGRTDVQCSRICSYEKCMSNEGCESDPKSEKITLRLHDVKSVEKRLHHADLRSMSEGGGRNYEKFCESFGIITLHSNTMSCMYEVDKRLE